MVRPADAASIVLRRAMLVVVVMTRILIVRMTAHPFVVRPVTVAVVVAVAAPADIDADVDRRHVRLPVGFDGRAAAYEHRILLGESGAAGEQRAAGEHGCNNGT